MGMTQSTRTNKGLIRWMEPDQVVDLSLKDLKRGKVVCVPGVYEKVFIKAMQLMPRFLYIKLAYKFSNRKKEAK